MSSRRDSVLPGVALAVTAVLGFVALLGGAAALDHANGLSVSESLGIAPRAREVRLIGDCNGRIMAALEEDQFPAGCRWIEPIRMESSE